MDYKKASKEILDKVGGVENISNMTHCATRLRLTLRDSSLIQDEQVKKSKE